LILLALAVPILVRGRRHLSKLTFRSWISIGIISAIGSALGTVLFTYSVQMGNPTTAVLLQKVQPVFAIILARFLLNESWPRRFPLLAFSAVCGAYLISFGSGSLIAPWQTVEVPPALLACGAAAAWGSATVFGRFLSTHLPFEMITALRIIGAVPFLTIGTLGADIAVLTAEAVLPLIMMALVPGFAGLMLYYRGLSSTSAAGASIAELTYPASAAVLNWAVLGVMPGLLQIIGLFVVWFAIVSVRQRQSV
jgi:drug/metabolite transporter (DMT)-like permease